jgi:hypothetical protein
LKISFLSSSIYRTRINAEGRGSFSIDDRRSRRDAPHRFNLKIYPRPSALACTELVEVSTSHSKAGRAVTPGPTHAPRITPHRIRTTKHVPRLTHHPHALRITFHSSHHLRRRNPQQPQHIRQRLPCRRHQAQPYRPHFRLSLQNRALLVEIVERLG